MLTEGKLSLILTISFFIGASAIYKDIVLVIDTSHSVNQTDLHEAIDFIYNVTKWLNIGTQDIQISVITYSSDVKQQFDLDDYVTNATLLPAIESLKTSLYPSGSTYTFDALMYVRTTSFLSLRGARNGTQKTVLVMTDGESTNYPETLLQAEKLRTELNAEVFAIGIGDDSKKSTEIQGIASNPDSYYIYYVDSFDYLCSVVPSLVPKLDPDALTQGIPTCPTGSPALATTTESPSQGNMSMIIGIIIAIAIVLLVATVITAMIINRATSPAVFSIEQQIVNAVGQYKYAPLGDEPSKFDTTQLRRPPVDHQPVNQLSHIPDMTRTPVRVLSPSDFSLQVDIDLL